jgi:hypothetical protein
LVDEDFGVGKGLFDRPLDLVADAVGFDERHARQFSAMNERAMAGGASQSQT